MLFSFGLFFSPDGLPEELKADLTEGLPAQQTLLQIEQYSLA